MRGNNIKTVKSKIKLFRFICNFRLLFETLSDKLTYIDYKKKTKMQKIKKNLQKTKQNNLIIICSIIYYF